MKKIIKTVGAILLAASTSTPILAAISDDAVKIGVLTDMSGPYRASNGPGSVEAAMMAIEDAGNEVAGKPVTLVSADDQNKADIGAARARQWFDVGGVDMVTGLTATSVTLAVKNIAEDKDRLLLVTGSASSSITNEHCSPNLVHWVYDTHALASGTAVALMEQGLDSWYFLTADYTFGTNLQADVAAVVKARGGDVLGAVRHPLSTNDFSSFILQAQGSNAKVIALANAGTDTINAIKAANEFGLVDSGFNMAGLLTTLDVIKGLGTETAKGLYFTTGFYWDRTPETRDWSQRFYERFGAMPTMIQAGVYSAVSHYLKAVEATGSDDRATVLAQMRKTPVRDFFAKNGQIREDGRMVYDMYLARVKAPEDSKGEWDLNEIIRTIPGDQAYRPLSESQCSLITDSNTTSH